MRRTPLQTPAIVMDYETPDGSQFSLREVYADDAKGRPLFQYTSIAAFVDGKPYAGKSEQRVEDVDDADILGLLRPVPAENIHPPFSAGFTQALSTDHAAHYLKAPSFMYEDSEPGRTFVADCLLNEVTVLERLRKHPHPNIVGYHGCVVKDGRITQLCLQRYKCNLEDYVTQGLSRQQREDLFEDVISAVKHLHSLGLAHNDICPQNVCIDSDGRPAIVDFDSCIPFGEKLLKGVAADRGGGELLSDRENDFDGLDDLKYFLDEFDDEGNTERGP